MQAMKSENQEEALQGIEFWSTVCETELVIEGQIEEGQQPMYPSSQLALGALEHLIPTVLALLGKQNEDDAEDDWNVAKV